MSTPTPGDWVVAHTRAAPPARRKRHVLGEGYRSLCGLRPKGGWNGHPEDWRTACEDCVRRQEASRG